MPLLYSLHLHLHYTCLVAVKAVSGQRIGWQIWVWHIPYCVVSQDIWDGLERELREEGKVRRGTITLVDPQTGDLAMGTWDFI
jgi:hypothetical protein